MKKQNWIFFFLMLLFVSATMYQQNVYWFTIKARGGLVVGNDTVSGTNTFELDSLVKTASDYFYLIAESGDTLGPGIANSFASTDVPMVKAPGMDTKTDNYTLVAGDNFKFILMNKATTDTVFVPLNASVAFPVSATQITIGSLGAGDTYVDIPAGGTINGVATPIKISAQWKAATLVKYGTDAWFLWGAV